MKLEMQIRRIACCALVLCAAACKQDPELVAKHQRQNLEIERLKTELRQAEEQLRDMPADVSAELAKTTEQAAQLAAEVARLEVDLTTLTSNKAALQQEFDAYRAKYPVPAN